MRSLPRNGFEREPRYFRSLPATVGWTRDPQGAPYHCIWCHRLHVFIGGFGHCPRSRNREFIVADFGPAPPAIRRADERGRLTSAAQEEIFRPLEKLDKEIEQDRPEPRVLAAFRISNRHGQVNLIVFCKYCKKWHLHGAGERPGDGNGHRVCHCHADWSPYHKSGYVLKEVGPATLAIKRDLKRRRARGVEVQL